LSIVIRRLYDCSVTWQLLYKNVLLATTDLILNHKGIPIPLNNVVLSAVDFVRDLGVIVNQHLKFDVHKYLLLFVKLC